MRYTIGCELGTKSTVEDCLEYFKYTPHIEVDTETTGLDCHKDKIVSLQLGDYANQWFIDARTTDILLFKDLLESKLCLLHNSKFDYKMLKKAGIILEHIYDTMLAECVLACGHDKWGYTLKALYKRYLRIELGKEEQKSFIGLKKQEFSLSQIEYGCEDVANLGNIRAHQLIKLKKFDLEYCANLENEAVKAMGDMEYNGMYLDPVAWTEMTNAHKVKLLQLQKNLDNLVMNEPKLAKFKPQGQQSNLFGDYERPTAINFGSPKQVLEICHLLGEPVENTNEREIGRLAKLDAETSEVLHAKHPFFGLLLQNREIAKVVSTYGLSFLENINPVTGRIHTNFWQVLNTGRVSSGDPNLQNLPAKNLFRNCFKARPGFKWVSIDYSGQELRIMADASGETGFIDVLNSGQDLHCYAGEMMFKKPIDKKKDKALRDKAKTINFGKPYGMGPPKLADTLGISIEEATELFQIYAEAFPTLNKWLEDQGKLAVSQHYSITLAPCKRRRWYPDMQKAMEKRRGAKKGDKTVWKEIMMAEGQTHRNGMNSPIQGTGADVTKEALVGVRELTKKYNDKYQTEVAYLICTVHDAIDVEVREDLAEAFSKEMAQIMIESGGKYVKKVKMEVDTTITDCWTK